ncbi:acyltransferase family protein [Anaerosporobacter faecicola]|uniref:acyltransferase family protein n=1 Tax=Anaerosporobacter faecicola TaxID=2718714 RepID=UPI001438936F|nr:acyltransferase [Anaerosporobacter faecicola]
MKEHTKEHRKEDNKFIGLSTLRGICACIIAFTFHYYCSFGQMPMKNGIQVLYDYGKYCVEIFFLISGFLIFYHYAERISNQELRFVEFVKKRLLRLYPLFFLSTIVTAILIYLSIYTFHGQIGKNDLYHLVLSLLMLGASGFEDCQTFNTPSWYISVLFLLYLIFYVIQRHAKKKSMIMIYCLLALLGVTLIHNNIPIRLPLLTEEMGRGYLSFSIGCILCYMYKKYYKEEYKKIILTFACSIIILTLVLIKVFSVAILGDICVVMGGVLSPAIVIICLLSNTLSSFFKIIHISFLDKISYSIYLWHCPMYVLINYLNANNKWNINFSKQKIIYL